MEALRKSLDSVSKGKKKVAGARGIQNPESRIQKPERARRAAR
jgi:hypothetical protein